MQHLADLAIPYIGQTNTATGDEDPMWRNALLATLLLLSLSACNLVVTKAPIVSQQISPSTLSLAEGLWSLSDQECPIKSETSIDKWPQCASWFINSKTKIIFSSGYIPKDLRSGLGSSKAANFAAPYFLSDSRPMLLQLTDPAASIYFYLAVEPLKAEPAGRLTRFNIWPVQCGPLPKKDKKSKPYAGLKVSPKDGTCATAKASVIVEAAKLSRNLGVRQTASFVRAHGPPT